MKLAILGSSDSWYARDIRRAAESRHEVTPVTFRDVTASIAHGAQRVWTRSSTERTRGEKNATPIVDLTECDAVLVRTMPPGSLEQVIFRMDALSRLEAFGICVLNRAKAIERAVDKYLTTAILAEAGLRTPDTITCQTADEGVAAFEALGGDVVVKPMFGGEGRGIARIQDAALALRAFTMLEQLGALIYVQEFIQHTGHDLRLLVIGKRVFGMRRVNETDWRTNISLGARAERLEVSSELHELAMRSATAIGATIAGVDVLPDRDGRNYVLEVNAVPGWRALSNVLGVDIADVLIREIETLVNSI